MSTPKLPDKPWEQLETKDIPQLRNKLLQDQDGKCGICKKSPIDTVWALDHCHKKGYGGSGLVRGVLCRNCNSVEGKIVRALKRFGIKIHELSGWLRNLADWLDKDHYPYIHPTERDRTKVTKTEFKGFMEFMKSTYNKVFKYPVKGLLTKNQESYYKLYKNKGN